ncbi:MAG: hypothetical protein ACLR23_02875 [Clostridia bacterium]
MKSYTLLFKDSSMWRAYGNTIIYAASSTLLTLITSVLAAYPLTVHRAPCAQILCNLPVNSNVLFRRIDSKLPVDQ